VITIACDDGRYYNLAGGRVEEMIRYLLDMRDRLEVAEAGSVALHFKGAAVSPEFRECGPPRRAKPLPG